MHVPSAGASVPPRAATSVRRDGVAVQLLGGFAVSIDGTVVEIPEPARRLVAHLALCGASDRMVIAGALWPDCSDSRAIANLRSTRWRVPKCLGHVIQVDGDRVGLMTGTRVDTAEAEQRGWQIISAPQSVCDADLQRTDLIETVLPGWYDDWVLFERERRLQLGLRFCEAAVFELIRRCRLTAALDHAMRLVECDPLREGGQRALISVYVAEGNLGQATRQLSKYARLLNTEVGCECSLELCEITARIVPRER